jgi:hypothetical protein
MSHYTALLDANVLYPGKRSEIPSGSTVAQH